MSMVGSMSRVGSSYGQQTPTPVPPANPYLAQHDSKADKGGKGSGNGHRPTSYPSGPQTTSSFQDTQFDAMSDAGATSASISIPPSVQSSDPTVGALRMVLEGYGCAISIDLNAPKTSFDSKLPRQDEKIEANETDADKKLASLEEANRKFQETIAQLSSSIGGHVTKSNDASAKHFSDPLVTREEYIVPRLINVRGWAPYGLTEKTNS